VKGDLLLTMGEPRVFGGGGLLFLFDDACDVTWR
jgi:hypothetical protein